MRKDGTSTTATRSQKTVSINDDAAHAEVQPLIVGLLHKTTTGQREDELRATADLVLKAATRTTAINATRKRVKTGPSRREHARVLESLDLAKLEAEVNHVLWTYAKPYLPKGMVEMAADLNDQPYHGEPFRDENELRRSEAKSGTTWFHGYATLYVVRAGKRFTLAVRFVRAHETSTKALKALLHLAYERGFLPSILYADKAFCTKEGLAYLREHVPGAVVPLPYRSKVRKLCTGKGSHFTTYTIDENGKEPFTVRVAVVVKRNGRKYHGRKPGNQYFPYAIIGLEGKSAKRIDRLYRNRGGIETSYSLLNEARPRTTSRNPAIRLFYYALALLLQNAWVHLRWVVSLPKRGHTGREQPKGFFPFDEFLELIAARLRKRLGEVREIHQLAPEA